MNRFVADKALLFNFFLIFILYDIWQVSLLFGDWFRLNDLPATDAAYTHYISQLQQNGFLKGDERTDSFFRIITVIGLHII